MAIKFNKYTGSGYIDVNIDYTEHKNRKYYIYFKGMDKEKYYLEFHKRRHMEEFLYKNEIYNFEYKSSNGKTYKKKWEYIKEKITSRKNSTFYTKGCEYSFFTGHYIGDK